MFWKSPVVVAAGCIVAASAAVYLWPGIDPASREHYAVLFAELPFRLLTIAAIARLLPRLREPAERGFWILVLFGFGSWFVADLIFQSIEGGQPLLWGVLEDCSFLLLYLCLVLAIEQRADRFAVSFERSVARTWVALTGALAMLSIFVYFSALTAFVRPSLFLDFIPSYTFFAVAGGAIALLFLYRAMVATAPWRAVYLCFAAAMGAWSITDGHAIGVQAGAWGETDGSLADFAWYAPYLFVILAAIVREHSAPRRRPFAELERGLPVATAWLYASVPACTHLAVYASGWLSEIEPTRQLVVAAATVLLTICAWMARRAALAAERDVHIITLDSELQESQKMESLGRLAGGVAHDFNNLLMILQGQIDLIRPELEQMRGGPELVARTQTIVRQGSSLTRQLLAFGRQSVPTVETLSPNEVLLDTERLLQRTLGDHICFEIDADEDLWLIDIDRGQLTQILVNLALNARAAMSEGGDLVVRTRNVRLARADQSGPREFVQIEVADSGTGMDAATRDRIFEPFFTTRGESRGSGLGLSVVHGIVLQAGGEIVCESEPGHGTRLTIHLPRSQGEISEPSQSPSSERESEPPRQTILVTDDQPDVRKLTATYLRDEGYHVLEAADGSEALSISERFDGEIDLLLTDVVMPGIGGVELAERMRDLRKGTEVLFVSGYARDLTRRERSAEIPLHFLQKPYTMGQLETRLRRILKSS